MAVGATYSLPPYQKASPPLARRFVAPGEEAVPGHLIQAPAQRQHAHVHVGAPAGLHLAAPRSGLCPCSCTTWVCSTPSRSTLTRAVASRKACAPAAWRSRPGCSWLFLASTSMRSWSSPPNHSSPCPVTQTVSAACAVRPWLVVGGKRSAPPRRLRPPALRTAANRGCRSCRCTPSPRSLAAALVVIAVKATHQALARGGGGVGTACTLQRHARLRACLRRPPPGPASASSRPTDTQPRCESQPAPPTATGCGCCAGFGFRRWGRQSWPPAPDLARLTARQRRQRHLALALRIQRQGQLVGHQACTSSPPPCLPPSRSAFAGRTRRWKL